MVRLLFSTMKCDEEYENEENGGTVPENTSVATVEMYTTTENVYVTIIPLLRSWVMNQMATSSE